MDTFGIIIIIAMYGFLISHKLDKINETLKNKK